MVQRRIRTACFPATKGLDTFDFSAIPSVNKALVMQLARCEYVERRENIIAIGNSGTGKTHVALGYGGSPTCCSDRIDAIGENRGPYPNSYQRVMVQEWSSEAKRRSGSGSHMGCDSACSYRRTGMARKISGSRQRLQAVDEVVVVRGRVDRAVFTA